MFVGPSLHDRGGVASVMDVLARNPAPGFRVVSVASTGGPTQSAKVATTAAGLARAATLLASGRIALVHIHASSYWSFRRKLLFFALARLFGRPVVWQIHCGRFEEYVGSLRPLERRVVVHALTRARRVVFLSHAAERAVAARLGLTNTTVAPHPSPAAVHEPSPEPLVVAFGTVGEAKGSFTLLRAFAEVVRRVPHARLVLAGDGARDAARAEAARLGVEQHVELPGWLDGEAKERLLARAAVLAHPSRVDALPMAVVEALSAGRPVVATSVGAIPEIVHDGVAGFIVPPDDPRALAAAIAQVLEDPELHARMCAAAAEAAAAFRPETVAAKFAEVYAAS
jgi:glycosyltransferase involved in cell wall biosynthesis